MGAGSVKRVVNCGVVCRGVFRKHSRRESCVAEGLPTFSLQLGISPRIHSVSSATTAKQQQQQYKPPQQQHFINYTSNFCVGQSYRCGAPSGKKCWPPPCFSGYCILLIQSYCQHRVKEFLDAATTRQEVRGDFSLLFSTTPSLPSSSASAAAATSTSSLILSPHTITAIDSLFKFCVSPTWFPPESAHSTPSTSLCGADDNMLWLWCNYCLLVSLTARDFTEISDAYESAMKYFNENGKDDYTNHTTYLRFCQQKLFILYAEQLKKYTLTTAATASSSSRQQQQQQQHTAQQQQQQQYKSSVLLLLDMVWPSSSTTTTAKPFPLLCEAHLLPPVSDFYTSRASLLQPLSPASTSSLVGFFTRKLSEEQPSERLRQQLTKHQKQMQHLQLAIVADLLV